MEENIVEQIRVDRSGWIDRLMVSLGKFLYKRGYLSEIAETDALTGLLNRNFYERWIGVIMSQAERVGVGLAFVMIDVDFLKKTNDLEGHSVGDRMLKKLARNLTAHARKSDIVIRFGGDEFLFVLWNCNYKNAIKIMKKQLAGMEKKGISFSFGVSEWKKGKDVSGVIHDADQQMYGMKRKRKRLG